MNLSSNTSLDIIHFRKRESIQLAQKEKNDQEQAKQKRFKNFQKLMTQDFSINEDRDEFTRPVLASKEVVKAVQSMKDIVKEAHLKFLQTTPGMRTKKTIKVPEFIKQRDDQIRKMKKIIQTEQSGKKSPTNKNNQLELFLKWILIITIIFLWKEIITNITIIREKRSIIK